MFLSTSKMGCWSFWTTRRVHWMNERPIKNEAYVPTQIEHIANVITHGLWVLPSMWASAMLIFKASGMAQFWSAVIYGGALVLLFCVSTIFHCVFLHCGNSHLKDVLHRCDRAMIYVFIAASSFPWLSLRSLSPNRSSSSAVIAAELHWGIWVLASLGILYQQLFHERYKWLETLFYMIMGFAPSLALLRMDDVSGVTELKIGGAIYIVGVIFFKSDGRIPCAHAIWHLHVVVAAAIHYYAIFNYLIVTGNAPIS